MNTPNPNNRGEDAFQQNRLRLFREQFYGFFDVFGTSTVRFQIKHADRRMARTPVLQQPFGQVDHEQRQIGGIRHGSWMGVHEVLQPPVLFSIAEIELNLEAQPIIIDQRGPRQRQITAKEQHMRLRLRVQIRFDDHHQVQRLGKCFVARFQLIDARFEPLIDGRLTAKALRQRPRIELVAIDPARPTPSIRASMGQVQCTIVDPLSSTHDRPLIRASDTA